MKAKGFRSLLPALGFFLFSVVLSGWLWMATDTLATSAREERQTLEREQAASRSKLMRSDADKDLILANLAAYQRLEQRSVTDGGNRLAWLEAAQEANRSSRLYGMQYTLEAASAIPGSADLERTLMKLRMPLLTESDLNAFLSALAAKNAGLFWTKSCTLIRTGKLDPGMADQPGLEADCEIFWYHIKPTAGS